MNISIKSTKDHSVNKINVLAHGYPGTGKTKFVGSAAKKFKTLIASAESGLLSLNNLVDDKGNKISCDYVEINKFEDVEEFAKFLILSKHDYQCAAIDSGTEIQQVCMEHILRVERRVPGKPQQQDWGSLNYKMVRLIRDLRDMPNVNFIMTALTEEFKNEDTSTVFKPYFQGQIQKTIAGYFDEVVYSFNKTINEGTKEEVTKYMVLCQGKEKFITKDRSGMLPKYMENDFSKMYETIFNKEKEAKK